MESLKDLIKSYIDAEFKKRDGGWFYFGRLERLSSDQREGEVALMLEREGVHSGYLIVRSSREDHEVSYTGKNEGFLFQVSPAQTQITLEQLQITEKELVLPNASKKEDWKSPLPINILIEKDFSEHVRYLKFAVQKFQEGHRYELWLPPFITEF